VKRVSQIAVVLVLGLLALPSAAQQSRVTREGSSWVEEITGSLPAARQVKVNVEMGNVSVRGGQEHQITYVIKKRASNGSEAAARRQLEDMRVSATRHGEMAVFEATWEGRHAHLKLDIDITLPRATELVKVDTDGGNVSVASVSGRVEAESGGGNVRVDDIGGSTTLQTGGGNVEAGTVGGDLVLTSGGGNIRIGSVKGRVVTSTGGGRISIGSSERNVTADTGGGSIQVNTCGGELKANTGGGSMEVGNVAGKASVRTGGGSIRLSGAKGAVVASTGGGSLELLNLAGGVRAETGGGSITAEFANGATLADSMLDSGAGDIVVYMPQSLRITVKASIDTATGHKIRSDFPEFKITSEGGQWGPRTVYAEGALNGGGPVLKVHTGVGNIDLRKR
jgi:DUF4097 and DUF4098 domain-containing protein YvlB